MPPAVATFAAARSEAASRWAAWAAALAAGGDPPATLELLEAGALLDIPQPADQLDLDAAAVREVAAIEARADAMDKRDADRLRPHGGRAGLEGRLVELRAELAGLEQLARQTSGQDAGSCRGHASRLRRQHPRAFPPATNPKPAKPAARSRRKPQESRP